MTLASKKSAGTRRRLYGLATLLLLPFLSTCNLFKVGLGSKVDVNPPEVAIVSPSQGAFVSGTLHLSGTASDDSALASVSVHIISSSGTITLPATIKDGQWTVDVPTARAAATGSIADGKSTISVVATDTSGKTRTIEENVTVDNTPPLALVDTPQIYGSRSGAGSSSTPEVSSSISLEGKAYDSSGLAETNSVSIAILKKNPDGSFTELARKAASGSRSWAVSFSLPSDVSGIADNASYVYDIDVTDVAGNVSSSYYQSADVWYLLGQKGKSVFPSMEILNAADQGADPDANYGFAATELQALRLSQDVLAPQVSAFLGDFRYNSASKNPKIVSTNLSGGSNYFAGGSSITGYVSVGADKTAIDGKSLVVKIKDSGGQLLYTKLSDGPSPEVAVETRGTSDLNFEFKLEDGAHKQYDVGAYTLSIEAKDKAGNPAATPDAHFLIDNSIPLFASVDPDDSYIPIVDSKATVTVVVSDDTGVPANGLAATAAYLSSTDQVVTVAATVAPTFPADSGVASKTPRSFTVSASVPPNAKSVDFRFVATDLTAGSDAVAATNARTTVRNASYAIDSSPPGAPSIEGPAALSIQGLGAAGIDISGSVSDDNRIGSVRYWYTGLSGAGLSHADPRTWPLADTSSSGSVTNWSKTLNLAGLAEGAKKLEVVAYDKAGNASPVASRDFFYDTALPVLTETGVGATPSYRNAAYVLEGSVGDSAGIAQLTVGWTKDGVAQGSGALTVTRQPDGSWSCPVAVDAASHANDGLNIFTLSALDVSGRVTSLERRVTVDTRPPVIEFSTPQPSVAASPNRKVNGTVGVKANASDNVTIARLQVREGAASSFVDLAGNSGYVASLDTTKFQDAAPFSITLRATDEAGNVTDETLTVDVDQASDKPVVKFLNVTTPAVADANVFFEGSRVQVTTEDDDGDVPNVYASIDSGAYAAVSKGSGSGLWERSVNGLSSGLHSVKFRATDLNGTLGYSDTLSFYVDLEKPKAAVSSPAQGIYRNAAFSLVGSASDDNGLATAVVSGSTTAFVETSVDNGASWTKVAVSGGSWSYALPAAFFDGSADGLHSVKIRATDRFGRTMDSPVDYAFYVDTTGPSVSVTSPSPGTWQSGTFSISGTIGDALSGAKDVYVWLGKGGSPSADLSVGWTKLAPVDGSWSFVVASSQAPYSEGSWNFAVRGVDAAGNATTTAAEAKLAFGIDQSDPTLAETKLDGAVSYRSGTFPLSLSLADTNALASVSWSVTKGGVPAGGATLAKTGTSGSLDFDYSSSGDGVYDFVFTVHDAAGKSANLSRQVTVDTTAPLISTGGSDDFYPKAFNPADPAATDGRLSGSMDTASGRATDAGVGVSKIHYWFGDAAATPPADASTWSYVASSGIWSINLNLAAAGEGFRKLLVAAEDRAGNIGLPVERLLAVDQGAPSLGETLLGGTASYQKAAIGLHLETSDTNALKRLEVYRSVAGGAEVLASSAALSGTSDTRDLSFDVDGSAAHAQDGENVFRIVLTDAANRSTTLTRTVQVDTRKPVLAEDGQNPVQPVVTIAGTKYVNGVVTLRGTTVDANLESLSYSYTDTATLAVVTGTAANPAAWSFTVDTTRISASGASRTGQVTITARDKAQNESSITVALNVWQDTDLPSLSFLNADADRSASVSAPSEAEGRSLLSDGPNDYILWNVFDVTRKSLNLAVVDDDLVDGAAIQVMVDQPLGGFSWTSLPTQADGTSVSASYDVYGNLAAGVHWLWVRASDKASAKLGAEAVTTPPRLVYLAVNKDSPSFAFSPWISARSTALEGGGTRAQVFANAAASDWYSAGGFTLSGRALDAQLAKVGVRIGSQAEVDIPFGADGSWQYEADVTGLAEGEYDIEVRATDSFGAQTEWILSSDAKKFLHVKKTGPALGTVTSPALIDSSTGEVIAHNGIVSFASSSSDSYRTGSFFFELATAKASPNYIASPEAYVQGSTDIAADTWYEVPNAASLGSFTFSTLLDTRQLDDDTDYWLYLGAEDGLGNRSVSATPVKFSVRQAEDLPTVATSGLSSKMKPSAAFTMMVADDDGWVPAASVLAKLDGDPIALQAGTNSVSSGRFYTSYVVSLPAGLSEGPHELRLSATDDPSLKHLLPAASSSLAPVAFSTDFTPPVLGSMKIDGNAVTETGLYTKGSFTLSGNANDAHAISSVTVTFGGVTTSVGPASPVASSYAWTYSPASAPAGTKNLTVTAEDDYGNKQVLEYTITVDGEAPGAQIDLPEADGAWLSGSAAIIGGRASDQGAAGVRVVEVAVQDAASSADPVWKSASSSNQFAAWTYSFDSGLLAEGAYKALVRATDKAGNVGDVVQRLFTIDQAAPRATADHTSSLIQTKDDVVFAGKADDAGATPGRAAASAVLSWSKDGGAATDVTLSPAANGDWSWTLQKSSGDGLYSISLVVTDTAGRKSSVSRTVQVDSTAPTLVVSTPVEGESATASSYGISGTARDTGGVGFDGVDDVEYSMDASSWSPLALTGLAWSKDDVAIGAQEGAKTLYLRSTDKIGNVATATVHFFYDSAAPVMAETGLAGNGNPAEYSRATNARIDFSGKVSDSDALAATGAFRVSIDGSAAVDLESLASPYDFTRSGDDWSLKAEVGAGKLADGTHVFVFTAKDIAGKTTSVKRSVTVDTTAPTAAIDTPSSLASANPAYWLSGATASVGGTALDAGAGATGVALVYYTTAAKGAAQPAFSAATWTLAAGVGSWNGTLKLSGAEGTGEGQYTLYLAAVDAVGNVQTTPASRDFGVDQGAPSLAESGLAGVVAQALPAYSAAKSGLFSLSGDIGDNNALAALVVTETKGAADPEAVPLATPASVAGKLSSWSTGNLPLHGKADGTYVYTIAVTDLAGKTTTMTRTVRIDTSAPESLAISAPALGQTGSNALAGAAYTFKGSSDDEGVGMARIYYLIDHAAAAAAGTAGYTALATGGGNWNFTEALDTNASSIGLAEGSWYLHVKAEDKAGNLTADGDAVTVAFDIDQANPTLTESAIGVTGQVNRKAQVAFGGEAADQNGLSSLTVTWTKDSVVQAPVTLTPDGDGQWAWTLPVDASGHGDDGYYELSLTATDTMGKKTSLARRVLVDTRPPLLSITSPTADEIVGSSSYTIRGTVDDDGGKGVTSLEWSATGAAGSWASITVAGNWSRSGVNFSGGAQGPRSLYLRASDGLNDPVVQRVDFQYDTEAPLLAVDPTPAYTRSLFAVAWTASDTNALASVTVSERKGSGPSAVVHTETASPGGYSYARSVLTDGSEDGVWTYTVVARDGAGRETSVERSVTIDTTKPSLPVFTSTPAPYVTSSLVAGGTASDAMSGIALVRYRIDGNAPGTLTGSGDWFGTIDLSSVGEGQHVLAVWSEDKAGKLSDEASQAFVVDRTNPGIAVSASYDGQVYRNGAFTMDGSLEDSLALGSAAGFGTVTASARKGGVTIPLTPSLQPVAGNPLKKTWSFTVPVDEGEGEYQVTIDASDAVGRSANTVTRTVVYDNTLPTVEVTQVSSVVGANSVNGTISFNAVSSDNNGIVGLKYWVTKGAAPTSWDSAGETGSAASSSLVAVSIDTTALDDGADYALYVVAKDKAGNSAVSAARSLHVDQATDLPVLALTNMDAAASDAGLAKDNLQDAGAKVTGTVSDDDGFDASTLKIRVDAGSGAFTDVATRPASGKTGAFQHVFDTGLAEGKHYYYLQVSDRDKGGDPVRTATIGPIWFVIDRTPPAVIFNALASPYVNATVDLSGTASDGNSVQALRISLDGGATWPEAPAWTAGTKSGSWSVAGLDLASLAPGSRTITIKAIDEFAKESLAQTTVIVDRTPPAVAISAVSPMTADSKVNGMVGVNGNATDANPVDQVFWTTAADDSDWQAMGGATAAWNFLLDTRSLAAASRLRVKAVDRAGNAGYAALDLAVDQATDSPSFAITNASSFSATPAGAKANPLDAGAKLYAKAVDDDWIDKTTLKISIDDGEFVAVGSAAASGQTVDFSQNLASLSEGSVHNLRLRVSDQSDKKSGLDIATTETAYYYFVLDKSPPTATVTPPSSAYYKNSLSLAGGASDGNTVAMVEYRFADVPTYEEVSTFAWDSASHTGSWALNGLDITGRPQGSQVVYIRATDEFGKISTEVSVSVTRDTAGPTIAVTGPVDGAKVNGSISLSGTTSDTEAYGDSYWWIGSGPAPSSVASGWTKFGGTISTTKQFNWSLAAFDTTSLADGDYNFCVKAFDAAGNESDTVYGLTIDQTTDIPVISLSGLDPAKSAKQNHLGANPILSGTVTDDDAVDVSTIRISFDGTTWVAPSGSLGSNASSVSFSHSLTPAQAAEGAAHDFYVTAKDIYGKDVSVAGLHYVKAAYWVDAGAPTIGVQSPAAGSFSTGMLTMTGTVGDGSVVTEVLVSTDGGTSYTADGLSYTPALGGGSWSWTGDISGQANGDYTLKIKATDEFANAKTSDFAVRLDKILPTVGFISPAAAGTKVNGAVQFTGTTSDGNGVASAKYWFGTNVATPPADSAAWLAVGGSAGSWVVPFDSTAKPDGSYKLWIRATDNAGNKDDQALAFDILQSSDAPVIAFNLPSSTVTTVFTGIPLTVSGTVSDDDGIKTLEYRLPGDTAWTLLASWNSPYPTTAQSWSQAIDSISNGTGKSFELRATDSKAETAYYQTALTSPVFTVAALSPEVTIESPVTATYYKAGASIAVSGNAVDGNAGGLITGLSWALDGSSTWTSFDSSPHSGSFGWSANIALPDAKTDGILKIRIKAVNDTGKYGIATVDVNVDKTAPSLGSMAVSKLLSGDRVNGAITVNGTASDGASLDRVSLRMQGTKGDNGALDLTEDVGAGSWFKPIYTTDLKDGSTLTLTATAWDKAGNPSATMAKTVTVDQSTNLPVISFSNLPGGQNYFRSSGTIVGTIADDDGVASLSFSTDGGSTWESPIVLGGGLSENFSYDFSALGDGLHALKIKATDNSGTVMGEAESVNVSYRIDREIPGVGILSPSAGSYEKADFVVTGGSDDENGVKKVEFQVNQGGWLDTSVAANGSFNSSTGDWTAKVAIAANGLYTIALRVTDNSDAVNSASLQVTVDAGRPTVSFTSPASNEVTNGSITIGGTAADAQTSVKTMSAVIAKSGTPLAVTGISPWSISLDTTAFDEAGSATLLSDPDSTPDSGDEVYSITVNVTATDQAGNDSAAAASQLTFRINQSTNAPTLAYTNLASDGSTYYASDGSVSGSASDDDGVARIEYSLDGGGVQTQILGGTKTETWAASYAALADGLHTIQVKAYDIHGGEQSTRTGATISFRIDRKAPSLGILSPAPNSLQKGGFLISGGSDDENGLDASHPVQYKVDAGALQDCGYDLPTKTWSATVSATGDGTHTITVLSKDASGKTTQATRDFTLDTLVPDISVITPDNGANVNGKVVFKGTTSDANGVAKVEYRIGKDSTWYTFGGTYNWQKDFPVIDSYGNPTYADETAAGSNIWRLILHLRVTDTAGNASTKDDYQLIVDPAHDMPVVDFIQPSNGDTVGGVVRVSGTSYDDDAVKRVEIAFDTNGNGVFNEAVDVWPGHTALTQVASPTAATETLADSSTKAWYAVNQSAGSWANWYVNINGSKEFDPLVVGETQPIRIKVRAIDTKDGSAYGIAGIPVAIGLSFDAAVPRIENLNYTSGSIVGGAIHVTATVKDESGISSLRFINQGPLNTTGTLIDNGVVQPAGSSTLGGQATLVSSGPNYEPGFVKYAIDMPIDTAQAGLFPGGSGVMNVTLEATDSSGHITQTYLNLQADNLLPTGDYTNAGSITVGGTAYRMLAGGAYNLQGTASDTGTVKGVDRIVAWLSKGTSVYDLRSLNASSPVVDAKDLPAAATVNAGSFSIGQSYFVTSAGGTDYTSLGAARNEAGQVFTAKAAGSGGGTAVLLSQAYVITSVGTTDFTAIGAPRNSVGTVFAPTGPDLAAGTGKAIPASYAIFIDKYGESALDGGSGGDDDGYNEDLSLSGSTYNWYVQLKTSNLADGAVAIHYSVIDRAGNAASYVENGFVANHLPTITSVTLGTDLNGNGEASDAGETGSAISANFDATGFTVRGRLLSFLTSVSSGNAPLTYTLKYGSTTLVDTSATKTVGDGASFPILDTIVSAADFTTNANAAIFTVSVTDSVGLSSGDLVVRMNVDNSDDIAPTIAAAALGTRYPAGPDAAKLSANATTTYTDYLVAATPSTRSTWEGHVEYAADSRYDNAGAVGDASWDADVSGKIVMRGKVYDNQRIGSISVAFSKAFDANKDGTAEIAANEPITIAHWDSGTSTLVSDYSGSLAGASAGHNWAFHLEDKSSPEVGLSSGHAGNWSFEWNSAGISGVTGKDVVATFTVTDTNGKVGTSTLRMDVVPYVTEMKRDSAYNTLRSRQGRYVFNRGENATVNGFNIWNSTADTIKLGSSANVSLPAGGASTSFTIAVPSDATSGNLVLTVGGIPMINNNNDNARTWNAESTGSAALDGSGLWTDDRTVHIWQSDSTATGSNRGYFVGSSAPVYPAMAYNAGTLYASWSNYSTANVYYGTNAAGQTTIYHSYDPLEHTDISYGSRPTVVYNANTYGNNTWNEAGAGGVQIWDANAPNNTDGTGTWREYDMEELYHNTMLMQFINQRVVNSGNDIHISYFDTKDKSLKYAYVANGDADGNEHQNWINLDGGSDGDDTSLSATTAYTQTVTATATTYTAAAATGNGLAISSTRTGAVTAKVSVPAAYASGATIMRIGGNNVTMPAAGYLTTITAAATFATQPNDVATYRPNATTVTAVLVSVGDYVTAGTAIATAAGGTVTILSAASGYVASIAGAGTALTSGTTTVATTTNRKILSAAANATAVAPGDSLYTYSSDGSTVVTVNATAAGVVSATTAANTVLAGGTPTVVSTTGVSRIYGGARAAAAGEYSAIDVTPTTHYPVIAYYDITDQTLKLAYARTNAPTAGAEWTTQYVMPLSDPNYKYSGKYVSMRIDPDGYVHLVFYRNSTGDLIYMKSTNHPTDGQTAYDFGPSVTLDSIGAVGIWADLSLGAKDGGGNYVPYISYLDSSYTNTFDAVKLAYFDADLVATGNNGWEYMNASLAYEVENVRTSVEYDAGTNATLDNGAAFWRAAIGYQSSDFYRIAYYVK
jgi:hypothetical protein